MKKQLVQQIKAELDRSGVEMPFPQRVVHMHPAPEKHGTSGRTRQPPKSTDKVQQQ